MARRLCFLALAVVLTAGLTPPVTAQQATVTSLSAGTLTSLTAAVGATVGLARMGSGTDKASDEVIESISPGPNEKVLQQGQQRAQPQRGARQRHGIAVACGACNQ